MPQYEYDVADRVRQVAQTSRTPKSVQGELTRMNEIGGENLGHNDHGRSTFLSSFRFSPPQPFRYVVNICGKAGAP